MPDPASPSDLDAMATDAVPEYKQLSTHTWVYNILDFLYNKFTLLLIFKIICLHFPKFDICHAGILISITVCLLLRNNSDLLNKVLLFTLYAEFLIVSRFQLGFGCQSTDVAFLASHITLNRILPLNLLSMKRHLLVAELPDYQKLQSKKCWNELLNLFVGNFLNDEKFTSRCKVCINIDCISHERAR